MRVAIPSNSPGGIDASRSEHFGHCDIFTLVELDEKKNICEVMTLAVPEHGAGGCMAPVKVLKEAGVTALVVGGIGAKPMQALATAEIEVYWADHNAIPDVTAAVDKISRGMLPRMTPSQACDGAGNCHHE